MHYAVSDALTWGRTTAMPQLFVRLEGVPLSVTRAMARMRVIKTNTPMMRCSRSLSMFCMMVEGLMERVAAYL